MKDILVLWEKSEKKKPAVSFKEITVFSFCFIICVCEREREIEMESILRAFTYFFKTCVMAWRFCVRGC